MSHFSLQLTKFTRKSFLRCKKHIQIISTSLTKTVQKSTEKKLRCFDFIHPILRCKYQNYALFWQNKGRKANLAYTLLGTALLGFRSCNCPWLRLSQRPQDHKPLRRLSLSPWQVCHLCPLHPAWP